MAVPSKANDDAIEDDGELNLEGIDDIEIDNVRTNQLINLQRSVKLLS